MKLRAVTNKFMVFCTVLCIAIAGADDDRHGPQPRKLFCKPGEYVSCYNDNNNICPTATCVVCPPDTYNLHEDQSGKCADCTACRGRRGTVVTVKPCTPVSDAVCDCVFGYFNWQEEGLRCVRNSSCIHGKVLVRKSPGSPLTCEDKPLPPEIPMTTRESVTMTTQVFLSPTTAPVVHDEETTRDVRNKTVDATQPPRIQERAMFTKDMVLLLVAVVVSCFLGSFVTVFLYLKFGVKREIKFQIKDKEKESLMNSNTHHNVSFSDEVNNQNGSTASELPVAVCRNEPPLPTITHGGILPKQPISNPLPGQNSTRGAESSDSDTFWMNPPDYPVSESEPIVAMPPFKWNIPGEVVSLAQASRPELNLVADDQTRVKHRMDSLPSSLPARQCGEGSSGALSLSLPTADSPSCEPVTEASTQPTWSSSDTTHPVSTGPLDPSPSQSGQHPCPEGQVSPPNQTYFYCRDLTIVYTMDGLERIRNGEHSSKNADEE